MTNNLICYVQATHGIIQEVYLNPTWTFGKLPGEGKNLYTGSGTEPEGLMHHHGDEKALEE